MLRASVSIGGMREAFRVLLWIAVLACARAYDTSTNPSLAQNVGATYRTEWIFRNVGETPINLASIVVYQNSGTNNIDADAKVMLMYALGVDSTSVIKGSMNEYMPSLVGGATWTNATASPVVIPKYGSYTIPVGVVIPAQQPMAMFIFATDTIDGFVSRYSLSATRDDVCYDDNTLRLYCGAGYASDGTFSTGSRVLRMVYNYVSETGPTSSSESTTPSPEPPGPPAAIFSPPSPPMLSIKSPSPSPNANITQAEEKSGTPVAKIAIISGSSIALLAVCVWLILLYRQHASRGRKVIIGVDKARVMRAWTL